MTPENPVVGGTVLRRAAIQSPNFEQGPPIVGWSVNADGSAYFGDVSVQGGVIAGSFEGTDFIINAAGAFFYSSAPALGNLVASIASTGGTDGFGNTYQANITAYSGSSYVQMGEAIINFFASGMYQTQQLLALGNAIFQVASGLQSNTDTEANIGLLSAAANSGSSAITLEAALVTALSNMLVSGNLTVDGSIATAALTVNGSSDTSTTGLPNGTISGTSGGASAGTAHTHGPGSFSVTNGQHFHAL